MTNKVLNLLMIDEEQLYAEHLVELLSEYYEDINLGFWDEKSEFVKSLRQEWDVLIFHRAYDMNFADVVGILQEQAIELPIIYLAPNEQNMAVNEHGYPEVLQADMIKTLPMGKDEVIVAAICLQADYIACKRQISNLRLILKEAEQRANILIKNSKSAVAYIDQGVHIFANDPYLELFGYQAMEEVIGVPVVDLISGGDNIKGFKQFLRKFDKGDRSQVEFAFESKRADGSTFASKLQLAAATFEGEPVTQIIIQQNNAGSAELAKKLAEAERQDSLTGLTNRMAFMEMLNSTQAQVSSGNIKSAALLYIRMDGMGKINSSAGLLGVDTAVRQVAYFLDERFAQAGEASVSRFGDSSFAVILSEVKKEAVIELAKDICQRAADMLIEVEKRTVTTTLAIGIAMMDINTPEASVVLSRALDVTNELDAESEEEIKVKVFDISQIASDDENSMAEYLKNALTHNQLQLTYQPIYDIETDNSDLFEVYVTLPQADGSQLTFDKIAPIAKKHQLLDKVDRWVLINASKHLASIRQTQPTTRLLVSLSSASLEEPSLGKMIAQLTKAIGSKQALTVQFNEKDLVDYLAVAKRQFITLASIDCQVGMYSFGSTAKSMDVLEMLTPAMVRLARSYSKNLDQESNLNTLKSLISNANQHGVAVLMPYIEEASTMSTAWSVGARFLQGDYLQPAAQTITFMPATEE